MDCLGRYTYWWESSDGLLLNVVREKVVRGVVDGHSTGGASREGSVVDDGHTVVGAVSGVLEIQDSGPIVGEVLGHLASGAGGPLTNIASHGGVEGVAAYDLVDMGRGVVARLDDGVKSLNGQRRASEAKSCVDGRGERESDGGERLHLGGENCSRLQSRAEAKETKQAK